MPGFPPLANSLTNVPFPRDSVLFTGILPLANCNVSCSVSRRSKQQPSQKRYVPEVEEISCPSSVPRDSNPYIPQHILQTTPLLPHLNKPTPILPPPSISHHRYHHHRQTTPNTNADAHSHQLYTNKNPSAMSTIRPPQTRPK